MTRPSIPDYKTWQVDGLGEVMYGPVPQPLPRAVHEDLVIGLMEAGTVKALYRGASHTLPKGALILGQPGEGMAFDPVIGARPPTRMCVRTPVTVLQKISSEIADRDTPVPFFPAFVTPDSELAALFRTFHWSLEQSATRLEISSRFRDMLTWIVRRHTDLRPASQHGRRERAAVRRVREYLDAHYPDNIDLEALARLVNLSPFYLSRVFRAEVGLPPHAYQTQVRVTRGKDLLTQGMAIDRAALQVGFFDQSHFTNHFRRLFGFTPGTYQRSLQVLRPDRPATSYVLEGVR